MGVGYDKGAKMNNIRDHFPNLNEFCSNDSKAIIDWMKEKNITREQWNYKSIFDREDISYLIISCPNIEFMIDGVINLYWETNRIDSAVQKIKDALWFSAMLGKNVTPMMDDSVYKISIFMKHSKSPARARILLWNVCQLAKEAKHGTFKECRQTMVNWITSYVNT